MITCYVWMTGFGNFSFFYIKQDYSLLRVLQMFWRLNFSVLLLMWTHGNTYILYYICPLHTFYFVMVYLTMAVGQSMNHGRWFIRFKLMAVGLIIYLIWDISGSVFDTAFGYLGTEKVIGANNGSVYEWYFRTSLDHWSAFLGMTFALNFPVSEQYFTKAKGLPLVVAGVIFAGVTIWWFTKCYMLPKLQYNLSHAYMSIIPLTSYVFFRNITPAIRSGVSMSLHELGKTTLETYLLQHHVWLTSNAKTLLNITPGYPWINFALATVLFYVLSKELYRLTMTLRGMIMPDDRNITIRNTIGMGAVLAIVFAASFFIHSTGFGVFRIFIACLLLLLLSILVILRFSPPSAENASFQIWSSRFAIGAMTLVVLLLVSDVSLRSLHNQALSTLPAKATVGGVRFSAGCFDEVSRGTWTHTECGGEKTESAGATAYCGKHKWSWSATDPAACPLAQIPNTQAKTLFKGRKVLFLGDSVTRSVYHQTNVLLQPTYKYSMDTNNSIRHTDLTNIIPAVNATVAFHWTPLAADLEKKLKALTVREGDLVVLGALLWDALHNRDLTSYISTLESTSKALSPGVRYVFVLPTTVIDGRLNSDDKRTHMTEAVVASYRAAVKNSTLASRVVSVIDTTNVSASMEPTSTDGVHYGEEVYKVISQMILNSYSLTYPSRYSKVTKKYIPKATGAMSSPYLGAVLLTLAAVMVLSMDSFLGIGFLSLILFGRSADWEAAYGPLHRKIFGTAAPSTVATSGRQHDAEEAKSLIGSAVQEGEEGRGHSVELKSIG